MGSAKQHSGLTRRLWTDSKLAADGSAGLYIQANEGGFIPLSFISPAKSGAAARNVVEFLYKGFRKPDKTGNIQYYA